MSPRTGLRVRPQRPARALFGLLLVLASVVAALAIYTRVGDRHDVLAVTRSVLAGEQLTDADLRVVSISSDDSIPSIPASARSAMVGQYAKVRMVEGSLLVADSVQARPLVDPSKVLMSVAVPLTGVPTGLREGSRLVLILTPSSPSDGSAVELVDATVAGVPRNLGELVNGSGSSQSTVSLSVEVPPDRAALVGAAKSVAVAVVAPDGSTTATAMTSTPLASASSTSSVPAGGGG